MSNVFTSVPRELRKFTPSGKDYGKFALITETPPISIRNFGLHRADVVYCYNPQVPASYLKAILKKNKMRIDDFIHLSEKELKDTYSDLINLIGGISNWGSLQPSRNNIVYDVHYPKINEKIRLFDCELNFNFHEEILEAYDIVSFNIGNFNSPASLLESPIRDILDSLQIDGLTKVEAIYYMLDNKLVDDPEQSKSLDEQTLNLPNFYYKLKEEYVHIFR